MSNMVTFVAEFADVTIEINSLFQSTREFCQDYLSDAKPEFAISIFPEDIDYERECSREVSLKEFGEVINYSDEYLETVAVSRKISAKMSEHGVLYFHGSAIAVDDKAYIFTAPSGTGKSTHVNLWRQKFGDRAITINDDKPFLKITDEGILVCGSPWDGKHRISSNVKVPLKAICILERGELNSIEEISRKDALVRILSQVHIPKDAIHTGLCLKLIDTLLNQTKVFNLKCNMNPEACDVSYEAMK